MSPPDLELFDTLRRVVAVLDELGVPHFIGGSVASMSGRLQRQRTRSDLRRESAS